MNEDIDYDAAMQSVVEDMENAALKFKARRYEPKPSPEAKPEEAAEEQYDGPTANELAAMLGE